MSLRPKLQAIFDAIVAAHPNGLTLNLLSEELVDKQVDYADIEELIEALEAAGIDLEGPEQQPPPEQLLQVLGAVRTLSSATGKRPSVDEIAAHTGLTPTAVRRALRLGRSAGC